MKIIIPLRNFTKNKKAKQKLICFAFFILKVNNYTLISTSTPLGNSNFINASIVFDEEE